MTQAHINQPVDRSKDRVAERLAQAHYRVDPHITRIVRLISPDAEEREDEPIKLLEVTAETPISGVVPVNFGSHAASGIYYPSTIVEVHPDELVNIQRGELQLPHGWRLGHEYPRSQD